MILGVYVVRGLHVPKTQPVAIKCGHLRMLVNVSQTNLNDMRVLPETVNASFGRRRSASSNVLNGWNGKGGF